MSELSIIRRLRKISASLAKLRARDEAVLADGQSRLNQLDAEKESVLTFLSSRPTQALFQEFGLRTLGAIAVQSEAVRRHLEQVQKQINRREKTIEVIGRRVRHLTQAADRKELEATLSDWLGARLVQGQGKDHRE